VVENVTGIEGLGWCLRQNIEQSLEPNGLRLHALQKHGRAVADLIELALL
jgi:hypothetical protein